MNSTEIATDLLRAHAANDLTALIALYTEAADHAETSADTDRACFFLTHAWIFALEAGDIRADALRGRLVAYGREIDGR